MADVARHAGVSTGTVSRALRNLPGVSDDTREMIKKKADELSYVVSPEASRLSRGSTGRVALVVPRLHVWFYAAMVSALEQQLRSAALDVLIYQVDGEVERNRFFGELPARRKVDAVVLVALPVLKDEAERLDIMGAEVVVAGGRIRDYAHVEVDDHAIGRAAVQHLIDLGHRRIAMIRTSDTEGTYWSSDSERMQGYLAAMTDAGLPVDPAHVVVEPYATDSGKRAMRRLLALEDPPTAVFAYSDELAIGALRALQEDGIDVPGQMSLVGVDGHPTAELFGITSVDQSVEAQGRLAGRLVLDLLGRAAPGPRAIRADFRLEVRTTTGPPPSTGRSTRRRLQRTPVRH
ncbi:MAG: LacI family DNA-binding transcriptional regulator [Nocardioides sp.]